MTRSLLIFIFVTAACRHSDDRQLTASEHRQLAAAHEARAQAERSQFDPTQTRSTVTRSPFADAPEAVVGEYNPTAEHLAAADRELARAAQHSRAAAKLEAFADQACQSLPSEQRAACPLLASQVELVQNDSRGVRLTIKRTADAGQIERRLQCHLAYARTAGFDRPSCPLFVKGMTIERLSEQVIALHGDSPQLAEQLQVQARHIFVGEAPTPVSMGE